MYKVIPLFDKILVKRTNLLPEGSTIVLPNNTRSKKVDGNVVAVGDDVQRIKIGDHVLFTIFTGADISGDEIGENLVLMCEADILAILEQQN